MAIDRETSDFLRFGTVEVLAELEPIKAPYTGYRGAPRPRPSFWQRIRHEASWRIPHAWRVLIHGECDGG